MTNYGKITVDALNRRSDKEILKELVDRAVELTNARVANNKTVTAITVSTPASNIVEVGYGIGKGGSNTYFEPAFTGCGSVRFSLPLKEWRLAKSLGFRKGYREYDYGYEYYNGQFGDACAAYGKALDDLNAKYPKTILYKISLGQSID